MQATTTHFLSNSNGNAGAPTPDSGASKSAWPGDAAGPGRTQAAGPGSSAAGSPSDGAESVLSDGADHRNRITIQGFDSASCTGQVPKLCSIAAAAGEGSRAASGGLGGVGQPAADPPATVAECIPLTRQRSVGLHTPNPAGDASLLKAISAEATVLSSEAADQGRVVESVARSYRAPEESDTRKVKVRNCSCNIGGEDVTHQCVRKGTTSPAPAPTFGLHMAGHTSSQVECDSLAS
jgi:hypothetical protein